MKLVFDIETNGLDPDTIWMIVAEELETGKQHVYCTHAAHQDGVKHNPQFREVFDKAEALIGHNIIGFDLPVMKKLLNWEPQPGTKIIDTMLLSQMNDFERPDFEPFVKNKFAGRHNMLTWSKALGGEEKHDDPDWTVYSDEMLERCKSDVSINVRMYRHMMKELQEVRKYSSTYGQAIKLEHEFAQAMAEQAANGWLMDLGAAEKLLKDIEVQMAEIEIEVEPQLKPRKIYLDKEPREAKRLKNGSWDRVTRDWFQDAPVESPYQRYRIVDMKLGNNEAVIDLLTEHGWQPTEWNWGVDADGKFFQAQP